MANQIIACARCGKITDKCVLDMCRACYAAKRRSEGKKNPEITCRLCGRQKPHAAHGLCASCNTVEHRKANNYKGPKGVCVRCGVEENIHAKGMCHNCYSKEYDIIHKEERREYDKIQRRLHPEKFKAWGKKWRDKNRVYVRELGRKFYLRRPPFNRQVKHKDNITFRRIA